MGRFPWSGKGKEKGERSERDWLPRELMNRSSLRRKEVSQTSRSNDLDRGLSGRGGLSRIGVNPRQFASSASSAYRDVGVLRRRPPAELRTFAHVSRSGMALAFTATGSLPAWY